MAIQNRRGIYSDFDPTKMIEGEFAVVQSGDPDTIDGKAVYISTQTGSVERVALYKDVTQAVSTAIDEVIEGIIENIEGFLMFHQLTEIMCLRLHGQQMESRTHG